MAIKLLGFLPMLELPLFECSCLGVYERNLLEARVITAPIMITVRLLSPEPFGWFNTTKFTRGWEPTLLWNHYQK
jgi:hypothetical protein